MKGFLLGFFVCAMIISASYKIYENYSESHETKCDKNYKLYSNYMYMVNLQAVENGFGELSLYTKDDFCRYYAT